MKTQLKLAIEGTTITEPMKELIEERFSRLDRYYDRITGCTVAVTESKQGQRSGRFYSLRVAVTVPKGTIVVNRQKGDTLYVAVREAFDAVRRRVQDYARLMRGQIKNHAEPDVARVVDLDPNEGFGFIETLDGRELYFHRNSVVDGAFARLKPGTLVHFAEGQGVKGPQASTVRLAGRLRPRPVPRV